VRTTERPETITIGTNELIGTDPSKLFPGLARLMAGHWERGAISLKWEGKAAERIVEALERMLLNEKKRTVQICRWPPPFIAQRTLRGVRAVALHDSNRNNAIA